MDWRTKVYRRKKIDYDFNSENWKEIRDAVFVRDKQVCLRCDKRFRNKQDINAHHITPRANGGSDDFSNLVTLCNECHDFVEINYFRTRAEIMGSYESEIVVGMDEIVYDREESFDRPDWHKYVYGGVKRQKRWSN